MSDGAGCAALVALVLVIFVSCMALSWYVSRDQRACTAGGNVWLRGENGGCFAEAADGALRRVKTPWRNWQ